MSTKKRLTLKQLKHISEKLKSADLETVTRTVITQAQKEAHLWIFDDRKALFSHVVEKKWDVLQRILEDGLLKFCTLYSDECARGSNRQLKLLLNWMNYSSSYAVESVSKKYPTSARLWKELVSGFSPGAAISKECRSAVMSTLFVALLNTIVQQRNLILNQLHTQCESAMKKL